MCSERWLKPSLNLVNNFVPIRSNQPHKLYCAAQSSHGPFFFLQLFVPNDPMIAMSAFAKLIFVEHICCLNVVNFKMGKQTKIVK